MRLTGLSWRERVCVLFKNAETLGRAHLTEISADRTYARKAHTTHMHTSSLIHQHIPCAGRSALQTTRGELEEERISGRKCVCMCDVMDSLYSTTHILLLGVNVKNKLHALYFVCFFLLLQEYKFRFETVWPTRTVTSLEKKGIYSYSIHLTRFEWRIWE